MFTDSLQNINNSSSLFNLNDTQNIWSSNKDAFYSTDPFYNNIRNRSLFSNSNSLSQQVLLERQNKPRKAATGERRETNLIVNYLPDGFFEKDLYDLFSKAGPIAHYHVVRNKENRSECYGFVDFEKSADAEVAIEMFHQYPIQNKKLKVQNAYEGLLIKQEEKEKAEKGIINLGYNVEIKNAPYRWTVNDAKNIFGKYGEILRVYETSNPNNENDSISSTTMEASKTFNIVYRYQTVANKVIKKKNKQSGEPLWPLGLEISLVGQEFVDNVILSDQPIRCRSRNGGKLKFDQLSDAGSWDSKFNISSSCGTVVTNFDMTTPTNRSNILWNSTTIDNQLVKPSSSNFDCSNNFWSGSVNTPDSQNCLLSASGRPILKHKDNINNNLTSHLTDSTAEHLSLTNNAAMIIENESSIGSGTNVNNSNSIFRDLTLFGNNQILDCDSDPSKKLFDSSNNLKNIWDNLKDTKRFNTHPSSVPSQQYLVPTDIYTRTQLVPSRRCLNTSKNLSGKYQVNVSFKLECQQPSGSFKLRGMAMACYKAKWDGVRLIVSSSGGNAGLAVATACRMLKLRCTIVVPITTHQRILEDLSREGADVIQEGLCWAEAHSRAEMIRDTYPGLSRLIHPYDDPILWTGYESIVDEIVADHSNGKIDMIVVSVGGGGLLNGIAQGITKNQLNNQTAILAMETEGAACLNKSMNAKQIIEIAHPDSIATSLGASKISQRSFDIFKNQEHHLFSMTCTDAEAVESCFQFLDEQSILVEPACGAALAALYNGTLHRMAEYRNCDLNVVVVVCGGRCIDIDDLYQMKNQLRRDLVQASDASYNLPPSCTLQPHNNRSFWNNDHNQFNQSTTSITDMYNSTQQYNKTPFSYSAVASKNLGPIKDQSNTISGSATVGSNIQQSFVDNNSMTIPNYPKLLSSNTTSKLLPQLSNNNTTSQASSVSQALPPTSDIITSSSALQQDCCNTNMIASPVGSQNSDKENRMMHLSISSTDS